MTNVPQLKLIRRLADNRLHPRAFPLPNAEENPQSLAIAYEMQGELCRQLKNSLKTSPAGYKVGCTSKVMQDYLKIPHPCAGIVLECNVYGLDAQIAHADFHRPGVECEIALRMGTDLDPRQAPFDLETVSQAIGAVMPAIELVDDRYDDFYGFEIGTLIVDDFFQAAVILGEEVRDWQGLDLTGLKGRLFINGEEIGSGKGSDILEHPLNSLLWLANNLAERGIPLKAGEIVMLGSVVKTHWNAPGEEVRVAFEGLGEVGFRYI